MKTFTDEDVTRCKALALAATGRPNVEQITIFFTDEEPVFLVRPLTAAEYGEHLDAFIRVSEDADAALLVDVILWPSQAEVARIAGDHPALAAKFGMEFRRIMGVLPELNAPLVPLSKATPAQLERAGLSATTAAELLTAGGRPHLLVLRGISPRAGGADVALVLRTPSASLYGAHADRMAAVGKAGKGLLGLAVQTVTDVCAWSREPLTVYLDTLPGIFAADLTSAFLALGGAGARTERKRL